MVHAQSALADVSAASTKDLDSVKGRPFSSLAFHIIMKVCFTNVEIMNEKTIAIPSKLFLFLSQCEKITGHPCLTRFV